MSTQIQFRKGDFQPLIAAHEFTLGDIGVKIRKGDDVEYDGNVLRINGDSYNHPKFRGAVVAGWMVRPEDYDPDAAVVRKHAGIKIRPADGGNPLNAEARSAVLTVAAEDQVVADVGSHAQATRDRNNGILIDPGSVVHVRTISTPAVQNVNSDKQSFAEAERRANNIKVAAGKGRTRDQMMAQMTPQERAEYTAKIEAKKSSKDGVDLSFDVGNGVDILDLGGDPDAVGKESVLESEGITFRNTNVTKPTGKKIVRAPAKVATVGTVGTPRSNTSSESYQRKIARSLCADFPDNYDFNAPTKKKLARLQLDYEDRPDVIRAVAAAENDAEMKELLVSEFPEVFA